MRFGKKYILAATAVLMFVAMCGCSKKVNDKYVDLASYYGVGAEGTYGIVVDGKLAGTAVTNDGKIYLPQEVTVSEINSKFFYDEKNNQIRFTTPDEVITADIDNSEGKAITYNGQVYLELTYVMDNSKVTYEKLENPDRIVVFTEMGNIETYKANTDTKVRETAGADKGILTDIKKDEKIYMGEAGEEWSFVVTENGIGGYVQNSEITKTDSYVRTSTYAGKEYTHITKNEKICLGWHLVTNVTANDTISERIANADGLNVISPTWFAVSDGSGEISSIASKSYVKTAHNNGLEVWALIDDFETDDDGNYYVRQVLKDTASRTNLINNIVGEVEKYEIDGINVDFENISLEYGRAYVQFIRELSIECRKKGIVLSADLYVPMSYNQYYGRADIGEVLDYLIIMGYDEHWAGCDSAGSVASISYVRDGVHNTIKDVDADRVINAIPFYTRIWSETPQDISDGTGLFIEDAINGNYYLASKAVGMGVAEKDLTSNGVEKYWLEDAGQYYGEYTKDGVLYRVWLEEERSVALKLQAMQDANLAGVACWQLGLEKNEIWTTIQEYLNK